MKGGWIPFLVPLYKKKQASAWLLSQSVEKKRKCGGPLTRTKGRFWHAELRDYKTWREREENVDEPIFF